MRVLVTGGRDFGNYEVVEYELNRLLCVWLEAGGVGRFVVIHGGATGADSLANKWAESTRDSGGYSIKIESHPVSPEDWRKLGKKAGPIRNSRMLDEGKPDICVAFPGGDGTADMVRKCIKAKVPVRQVAK